MFLVVAKKGIFPGSRSADEQVCRSWEGAQPGSWPKLASGNIPYHRCHAQFGNGAGWRAGGFQSFGSNPLLTGSLNFFSGCESVIGW